MNKKIYSLSTYKEIIKEFEMLKFKEKYELINYLFITGNYEVSFELLKKIYGSKLSKKEIDKVDFLQLIYHINNNDTYNTEFIRYKLNKNNEKEKWYYNLICEDDIEKKIKLFEELVATGRINKYFRYKKYKNKLCYIYLMNLAFLDNPIKINYIEKYINKTLKKIKNKKVLAINEINFIENISNIIFSSLSFIYLKNNGYFIDFIEYEKILKKVILERKKYSDFTQKRNIEFNTIMYKSIKDLINLDDFNEEKKIELVQYLDEFLNENIDNIDESIKISKKVYNGNFWDEIENILKEKKENINFFDLIITTACYNYKDINEMYEKIDELIKKYEENISQYVKNELILCRECLNLWENGNFNKNAIDGKYRVSDFYNLLIDFFNGEISQEDFIFELNNINKIDPFEIINWKMIEKKCKVFSNFEWLSMILDKINVKFDFKAIEYFENFYEDIFQSKKTIFLKDFISINNRLVKKFDYNYFFLVNSVNILVQHYEDFRDAEILIEEIVNNWEKIKIKDKETYFIHILMVMVEQKLKTIDYRKIIDIVTHMKLTINKKFIFLYMSIVYPEIEVSESDYKEILEFIIDVYENIEHIDDLLYRIIASFAMKYEENKNIIKFPGCDVIYYKNDKHYYIKTSDKLLNKAYNLLGIEEIDSLNNSKPSHLLMFLLCRIFFEKIEEKGLGKKIAIPINANAKEIMMELNKALGLENKIKERNKVREGEYIDVPWMNVYDYSTILEDIVSAKWKMFYNSKNNRFLSNAKILHISAVILLCKIGRLDVLEKNNCYISNAIYEETIKRSNKEIVELGRGIEEEAIFYDEELDRLAISLKKIAKEKERNIYTVTKAKIIPKSGLNKFDDEMIKFIFDNINENIDFCMITEDPYWFKLSPLSNIAEGIISLLIDSYKDGVINSEKFFDSINKLNNMKYNMNIGNVLYEYLLLKSEDKYIKESINIINNYKLRTNSSK